MVDHIRFTPQVANDWKSAQSLIQKEEYKHCERRVRDASTYSQLQSKLWLVTELSKLNVKTERIALLGGWYANFIVPLLIDELKTEFIENFEIDRDVKTLSYKFNKRYKEKNYKCKIHNAMFNPIENLYSFDVIINTSCEHMFPMFKFREINKKKKIHLCSTIN